MTFYFLFNLDVGTMVAVGPCEHPSPLEFELDGVDLKLEWPKIYKSVDHTEEAVEGILDHPKNQDSIESLSMNKGRLFAELVFEVEDQLPWLEVEDATLLPTLKLSLQVYVA
jgi:hypothetical protein